MDNIEFWLTPLLILPGVGLLIMSTSARYAQIHTEVHHLLHEPGERGAALAKQLYRRSKLFRNALVSLYLSVSLFVMAGLIGGFVALWGIDAYWGNALFSLCRHHRLALRIDPTNPGIDAFSSRHRRTLHPPRFTHVAGIIV